MENTVSINRTSVCELVRLKLVTWESCEDHAGVGLHSVCVCVRVRACLRVVAGGQWHYRKDAPSFLKEYFVSCQELLIHLGMIYRFIGALQRPLQSKIGRLVLHELTSSRMCILCNT